MARQKSPHPGKKGRYQLFSPGHVAKALLLSGGIMTRAAKRLKCDRQTVADYCARYPEVEQARVEGMEGRLDEAEDQLIAAVKRGEAWATCFLLKCQAKGRGYVERQEITGANGEPMTAPSLTIVLKDDKSASVAKP